MSKFVTKLRETRDEQGQTGRDGISWPSPPGTWKQNEDISRLATFAGNLDVSQSPGDTDLLNSVPTPWARLLLFESALTNAAHPSHADIKDQWRGLLGVLALAGPLRLNLTVKAVKLSQFAAQHGSLIAKSFVDLRPHHVANGGDAEQGKWDDFQMILIDGEVVGATSPRTLAFTGVAHQCPASIPFRSPLSRLSDPVAYYKRFGDINYLGLLARWLNGFISSLEQNPRLDAWMGAPPTAPGASQNSRLQNLLESLREWQQELAGVTLANVMGATSSRFTLSPYDILVGLPEIAQPGRSDLFVRGRRDLLVGYRPGGGSRLLNAFDQELVNEPLRVYDGRWIQANQPLPTPLSFMPDRVRRIEDPAVLFEDVLIQVALPASPEAVYDLSVGDRSISQKRYLYPFKPEVLDYFEPADIAANTRIVSNPQTNSLRVEFEIPVENNRKVRASREYPLDTGIITDDEALTSELAVWPDFTCAAWSRYFYFKTSVAGAGKRQLDFQPATVPAVSREHGRQTWYATREPVRAFAGSVDGKSGLLLLRDRSIPEPSLFWRVGVDFGSTHTRAFSLRVTRHGDEQQGYSYVTSQGSNTEPIRVAPRAQELTVFDEADIKKNFFALVGQVAQVDQRGMGELKTLMMLPEPQPGAPSDWLPREGYVYSHWIYDGEYDQNKLHFNLKWNSNQDDHDLRAFLRCLLIKLQAEAVRAGARVVSVSHTYPSVFTEALKAKHDAEWLDLQSYLNLGVRDALSRVTVHPAAMTETVAVCRHLECDQDASPVSNTISLDVGGSTTDIAVWAQKKLELQESVKLAAGVLGRYLQSPDAQEFLKWFEATMHSPPYNLRNVSLASFAAKPSGYSLMFTNLLSALELAGLLEGLINQINAEPGGRRLMSHIIYLNGALLYYAGLLARKAGLPSQHETYNIYFCGKGGTLVRWVKGYDVLAQEMFEAGLFGPAGRGTAQQPTIITRISRTPKEEVGRGLLAESELQGNPRGTQIGLVDPNPPSVTVGETGYGTLKWDGELSPETLRQLPDNTLPPMDDLKELKAFLEAFKQGRATRGAAAELKLNTLSPGQFRSRLLQRLFGAAKGCIISDIKKNDADALLEPLFITETKVLLEAATGSIELFL